MDAVIRNIRQAVAGVPDKELGAAEVLVVLAHRNLTPHSNHPPSGWGDPSVSIYSTDSKNALSVFSLLCTHRWQSSQRSTKLSGSDRRSSTAKETI